MDENKEADWPFADPPNVATFTVRQIVDRRKPILLVTHHADDGAWCFMTGDEFRIEDALIIGLGNMLKKDPGLAELADLPEGWLAMRESADSPWERVPNDSPAED